MGTFDYNLQPGAMRALRSLNNAMAREARSQERIATGLKFNRAADNPSAMGMVERLNTQRLGSTTASRNINDAITMAQTADGGLSAALGKVQEMRELALTALNDTNSAQDMESLDQQMQMALEDLDRIRNTTRFNGRNLFQNASLNFQVGSEYGNTLSMEFESFSFVSAAQQALDEGAYQNSYSDITSWLDTMGVNPNTVYPSLSSGTVWADERLFFSDDERQALATAAASSDPADHPSYTLSYLDASGQQASQTYTLSGANYANNFVSAVNADTATTGWSVALTPGVITNRLEFDATAVSGSSRTIRFNVDGGTAQDVTLAAGSTLDDFVAAVNSDITGVTAVRDDTSNGVRLLSDGNELEVRALASSSSGSPLVGLMDSGPTDAGHYRRGFAFSYAGDSADGLDITFNPPTQTPASAGDEAAFLGLQAEYDNESLRRLNPNGQSQPSVSEALNLREQAGAEFVLAAADIMVDELASRRGYYGAMQRRFDSALNLATEARLTAQESQARLTEADFAAETSEQAEAQMLMQTSITALSQLNGNRAAMVSLLLNQSLGFSGSF